MKDFLDLDITKTIRLELEDCETVRSSAGLRNPEQYCPTLQSIIHSPTVMKFISAIEGEDAQFVRAIVFDKSRQNNWRVRWHQDKTIALSNRVDIENWGPWSIKEGVTHVQPPLKVLEKMVTVRIHLDDCDVSNGCLSVIPGSHAKGLLPREQIARELEKDLQHDCPGRRGSALLMRPLLLHSSNKSTEDEHRRILHLEFCNFSLPAGLTWN